MSNWHPASFVCELKWLNARLDIHPLINTSLQRGDKNPPGMLAAVLTASQEKLLKRSLVDLRAGFTSLKRGVNGDRIFLT
jgi:hypothetical protein